MTTCERLVLNHLSQFVSDHKKQFAERVLDLRTRQITVALEDIYQSQNASAVIRTCECMGVQDIHIIEQETAYEINRRVLKGADKWMDLYRYHDKKLHNTAQCFHGLRAMGYTIFATDPGEDGISIHEIDVSKHKIALLFGNELRGISAFGLENCDAKVRIPMYGFTESLNISVSVAICLNTLIPKLHQSGENYGLTPDERDAIKLRWYRKIVRGSALIERVFLRAIQ